MVEEGGRATAASSSIGNTSSSSSIIEKVQRFERERRKREKKKARPSLPHDDDGTSAPMPPSQIDDDMCDFSVVDIETGEILTEKTKPSGAPETIGADDEPPTPAGWTDDATIMNRKEVALPSSSLDDTTGQQKVPPRSTTPNQPTPQREVVRREKHPADLVTTHAAPLPQRTTSDPSPQTQNNLRPPPPSAPPRSELSVARPRNKTSSSDAPPSSVPPTVDDATVVQGGEATPVYVATVVPQESIVREDPSPETTDSQEEDDEASATTPWWRAHRKLLIAGVASVAFGAMAATIGVLLGSKSGDEPSETDYYADRGNHRCVNEKGRQPYSDDDRGNNFFPTVEQCCKKEFWVLNDGVCIMNSESLSALSDTQLSSLKWTQEGETLNGDPVEVLYDGGFFGRSMCLSNDGTTLVIGAPGYYDTTVGYVRVYRKEDGGGWKQRGQTIRSASANDYFGSFLSVSADGEFVAIGTDGLYNDKYHPYTKIFRWDEEYGFYKQMGQNFDGSVVSLSADAKTLAIGDFSHKQYVKVGQEPYTFMFVGRVTV